MNKRTYRLIGSIVGLFSVTVTYGACESKQSIDKKVSRELLDNGFVQVPVDGDINSLDASLKA